MYLGEWITNLRTTADPVYSLQSPVVKALPPVSEGAGGGGRNLMVGVMQGIAPYNDGRGLFLFHTCAFPSWICTLLSWALVDIITGCLSLQREFNKLWQLENTPLYTYILACFYFGPWERSLKSSCHARHVSIVYFGAVRYGRANGWETKSKEKPNNNNKFKPTQPPKIYQCDKKNCFQISRTFSRHFYCKFF